MITSMFVHNYSSGKVLFDIVKNQKGCDESLICMFITAMSKFSSEIFSKDIKRMDFGVFDTNIVEIIPIFEEISVDIVILYERRDHPVVHDLLKIIIRYIIEKKDIFFECDMLDFSAFLDIERNLKDIVNKYIQYKICTDNYIADLGNNYRDNGLFYYYKY